MKCPSCGAWNRASLPVCQKCGEPLAALPQGKESWRDALRDDQTGSAYYRMDEDGESSATPDSRDSLAREMAELKKRKADGELMQRKLRQTIAQRVETQAAPEVSTAPEEDAVPEDGSAEADGPASAAPQDGGEPPASAQRRPPRRMDGSRTTVRYAGAPGSHLRELYQTEEPLDNSRNYDLLWAEQAAYAARWQPQHSHTDTVHLPRRVNALKKLLRVLAVLLILALLGACGFFGWHYFQDRKEQELEENRATVAASIMDELAAHTIMIPGDEGAQIYIRELHASYIVSGGYATVEIADHSWYDNLDELTQESMEVTLTPFLKTASGQQKPLELITYTIDIPLSPITLMTPDSARTTVASSMYTMQFEVRPGSKVTINGKDVSDTINAQTGIFSYNATVQPVGDNVFTVRCRSQYCRETSLDIVLYRAPQEIPLDLAADTFTSTSYKTMTVSCTTLPGATVDVESPFSDLNITDLDSTGAFSFIAIFDHIGNNLIKISSSYPGKKTSTIEYTVYYVPPVDKYTSSAWPLNREAEYTELLGNISFRASRTQVYVITGKVDSFISEKPQQAVFYTSDDGKSRPVVLENYTKTTWEKGVYYRIYADVYGNYSNMPWLYARFTYPY